MPFNFLNINLLDVITGSTAPASYECLVFLTCLINNVFCGKATSCLASWLCGGLWLPCLKRGEVYAQLILLCQIIEDTHRKLHHGDVAIILTEVQEVFFDQKKSKFLENASHALGKWEKLMKL